MALKDYQDDMMGCSRCSTCKWVPYNQQKSWRFAKNCPSIVKYNFHAYSGSGRMIMANSMLHDRSELNDTIAEIVYKCQLCGACDTACKAYRDDIDINEVLLELRAHCVEQGFMIPEHTAIIDSMKREDNVLGEQKAKRGDWAEGLDVKDINKEQVQVLFHAGCRYSYDPDLRDTVRGAIKLLRKAGIDVGIAGKDESCCGGRAYELGYRGEASNFADDMASRVKASGARTLVTACSDCFATYRYIYPRMNKGLGVEILHISQFLERLVVEQKKLSFKKEIPMSVTYHDPCHLGRMSEPFTADWTHESKLKRPMYMKRQGWYGIYDPPRKVLTAIPGIELTEMERIREWSWCCGAGGGVLEAYPELAEDTAVERIDEAKSTGAEALVTACPWCLRKFKDTVSETGEKIKIYDLIDLALMSAEA